MQTFSPPRFIPISQSSTSGHNQFVKIQLLPFTIRIANHVSDFDKAIKLRYIAYMRHLPELGVTMKQFESDDLKSSTVILIAESKLDGSVVGTMRIQNNQELPLPLEASLQLPEPLRKRRLAEASRLAVAGGGRVVSTALFKAFFTYCNERGIDEMVITARSPVDRQYDRLLFRDVYPEIGYINMAHVGNLPHRVMHLGVKQVETLWKSKKHPLFNFFFSTQHADIDVGCPRRHSPAAQCGQLLHQIMDKLAVAPGSPRLRTGR